mmetsp:Transcript_5290/g.6292  ORF Transcript_5290/g.6292 Transcript_5290/m.6292 type:complete len:250 (-) Transcript_5290:125-874(-)
MARVNSKKSRKSAIKRWKTFSEKEVLECYFQLDPNWGRKTINYLRPIVKLSEEQIYKWGYERKKKLDESYTSQQNQIRKPVGTEKELKNLKYRDYNALVDELFPTGTESAEVLTREEKMLYDRVKEELMNKDEMYQKMTELDRLLCERIKLSDTILKSNNTSEETPSSTPKSELARESSSKAKTKSRKSSMDEECSCSTLTPVKSKQDIDVKRNELFEAADLNEFNFDLNFEDMKMPVLVQEKEIMEEE